MEERGRQAWSFCAETFGLWSLDAVTGRLGARCEEELEVARNELAGCEGADAVTRSQRRRSNFSSLLGTSTKYLGYLR